jgi:hypothetical protein
LDEVDNLILQVKGEAELKALNVQLEAEKRALTEAIVSHGQHDAATRASAAEVIRLTQEIGALAGKGGIGGGGILQASYAVQDFVSVLSGGQGLARALASVQNNIPGLLMSLGATGGLAGIVSLASLAVGAFVPVLEKMWGGMDDKERVQAAKERLKELQHQVEETHKAFLALEQAPTDSERTSAEGIKAFLSQRPHADQAREAVAAGLGRDEAIGALSGQERLGLAAAEHEAAETDEQLRRRAHSEAMAENAAAGGDGLPTPEDVERKYQQLAARRDTARAQAAQVMTAARNRRAESIVTGATVAGPAGAAARKRLLELTPGMPQLQGMTPEAIERDEAWNDEIGERLKEAEETGRALRDQLRKRRREEQAQRELEFRGKQNVRAAERAAREKAERDKDQAARDAERDDAKNLREYQEAKKTAPFRRERAVVARTAAVRFSLALLAEHAGPMDPAMMRGVEDALAGRPLPLPPRSGTS